LASSGFIKCLLVDFWLHSACDGVNPKLTVLLGDFENFTIPRINL
jgi:hypothetical protein